MARILLFCLVFFAVSSNRALASAGPAREVVNAGKRYVIGAPNDPIKIKSTTKSISELYMRDPNLSGQDKQAAVPAKAQVHVKPAKTQVKSKSKHASLGFKPLRVAGSVRMPRVSFGRVGLSGGLRDESHSLDFIGKSLSAPR